MKKARLSARDRGLLNRADACDKLSLKLFRAEASLRAKADKIRERALAQHDKAVELREKVLIKDGEIVVTDALIQDAHRRKAYAAESALKILKARK